MPNSTEVAARWVRFVAGRPDVSAGPLIQQHFSAGKITRLCDCGCQSFSIEIPDRASLKALPSDARGGCVLSLAFRTQPGTDTCPTVEIDVFADDAGFLAGMDVSYIANSAPMPDSPSLQEPPLMVSGRLVTAGS